MQVFTKKESLTSHLKTFKKSAKIGFVPTMGALHIGHLSLVKRAIKHNDVVVVSVFVNPTQFNNENDLKKYPRDLQADIDLLESFNPNIVIFCPSSDELYGNTTTSKSFNFGGIENEMEGAFRPGHFNGVGTIIAIFFDIINPTNAYFGEKDFQQLQIIKALTSSNNFRTNIVGCPIFREDNGLAFSSRNKRLSEKGKQTASFIYKVLDQAKKDFGTIDAKEIVKSSTNAFIKNSDFNLEYFLIAEIETLKPTTSIESSKKYRAFVAASLEGVRLIDNIALN